MLNLEATITFVYKLPGFYLYTKLTGVFWIQTFQMVLSYKSSLSLWVDEFNIQRVHGLDEFKILLNGQV